ncbi:MAG: hypothetical protein RLZZ21_1748 [Planctomycetota bacterium]
MSGGRQSRAWTLGGAAVLVAVWASGLAIAAACGAVELPWKGTVSVVAAVCLAGAVGGWLLARLGDRLAANPSAGRHGLAVAVGLGGVAVRLLLPLAMLAWLRSTAGGAAPAGADRVLLGLYLSLLATDIVLTIIGRAGSAPGRGHSGAN